MEVRAKPLVIARLLFQRLGPDTLDRQYIQAFENHALREQIGEVMLFGRKLRFEHKRIPAGMVIAAVVQCFGHNNQRLTVMKLKLAVLEIKSRLILYTVVDLKMIMHME